MRTTVPTDQPTFTDLGVPHPLVDVLAGQGITSPTPIQAVTLPDSMAGRDVLGRGRTGSGKTFAFLLPMVARLAGAAPGGGSTKGRPQPGRPRALILVPTRELAMQIEEALVPLAQPYRLTSRTIFGGVNQNPQVSALRKGVDVVVACPGRLEDLMGQGHVDLGAIEITVLDEADHMADLGFLPGVKRILGRTPRGSQRMLFSATLDAGVNELVRRFLDKPVTHEADSAQSPVSTMDHHVLHVTPDAHLPVLVDLTAAPGRRVVFTRTKHRAKKLARQLNAAGVPAVELHGNLSQNARVRTMDAFHSGAAPTLVATDIAARGIHVDDVSMVIHADPPVEHKAYLHRSGRTARAGASGTVVTLMTDDQVRDVRDLTRKAGIRPTTTRVTPSHPLLGELAPGERAFPGPWSAPGVGPTPPKGGKRSAQGGRAAGARSGGSGSSSGGGGRAGGGRSAGGSGGPRRGGAAAGAPASGSRRSGSGTGRQGSGRSGAGRTATAKHVSRSGGGAAAFSAGSRAGRRG